MADAMYLFSNQDVINADVCADKQAWQHHTTSSALGRLNRGTHEQGVAVPLLQRLPGRLLRRMGCEGDRKTQHTPASRSFCRGKAIARHNGSSVEGLVNPSFKSPSRASAAPGELQHVPTPRDHVLQHQDALPSVNQHYDSTDLRSGSRCSPHLPVPPPFLTALRPRSAAMGGAFG
jgi:hypothetical protein